MKTVIMAGGKGTRISSVASDIPKPMIKIEGKPVLEHEIECLRDQGFTDLIITVSHLGSIIMNYFGNGSRFGVSIQYFNEETPLGNAGALFKLREQLTDDFLLLNADAIFDVDFNRFVDFHRAHGGLVTLFTHPNNHPYDSGVLIASENGAVDQWLTKEDIRPQWYRNCVNAGLHVINPSVLDMTGIDPDTVGTEVDGKIIKVFSFQAPKSTNKASSEQLKNTAITVPIVMNFLIYKSAAITDVPHCGTKPNKAPKIGEVFFLLIKKLETGVSIKERMT